MKTIWSVLTIATLLAVYGCGKPKIGESCTTAGDSSLCESGALCTNNAASSGSTCRKECTTDADCLTTE